MPPGNHVHHPRERDRLADLGPLALVRPPSENVLRLASRIGLAWSAASLPTRRAVIREWVSEVRIRAGGLDIVPQASVATIVYAAQRTQVGTVGDAGVASTR